MKKVDLSIIITAHTEGLLAHKTLLSVFRALKLVESQKLIFEIIVNIDRGDDATIDYFNQYKNDSRFKILKSNFGDLGLSRNHALTYASGEFVAYLDADDMISKNWFLGGINYIKISDHDTVVHPRANIIFGVGVDTTLCLFRSASSQAVEALIAIGANRWVSTSIARKEVYKQTPYTPTKNGFGHEDYTFNLQTLAKGIMHEVVPETTLFYRRKTNSLMNSSNNKMVTQPYTDLFSIEYLQSLPPILPVQHYSPSRIKLPEYVQKAMIDINSIDAEIQFTPEIASNGLPLYNPDTNNRYVSPAFRKIIKNVDRLPDYVFIVPWVVPGGADKVLINYLEALKTLHPKWRIAVITTLPSDNPWLHLLPSNTYHLDFGNNIAELNEGERDILMCRLLIQLKCKKLHIINSEYGYRWVMNHMDLVRHNFRLDCSVFSYVKTIYGFEYSYIDPEIREIYPVVRRIFTDNQAVIDLATARNGFDPHKFKIHHQPIEMKITTPKEYDSNCFKSRPVRVLWAGRIDSSKRPDLVAKVAKRLDPKKFQLDVYGKASNHDDLRLFKDIPTLNYKGPYQGFASLPTSEYDLLLYTSTSDGMPNVLLETSAAGLPIIASKVGGIGEFVINEKTGIAITDYDNPDTYIAALMDFWENPAKFTNFAQKSQELLGKIHSYSTYLSDIKGDFE